jgi:hypothetical protein
MYREVDEVEKVSLTLWLFETSRQYLKAAGGRSFPFLA